MSSGNGDTAGTVELGAMGVTNETVVYEDFQGRDMVGTQGTAGVFEFPDWTTKYFLKQFFHLGVS